jgi:hypothetical protein
MSPDSYTELFFLDEAVALAAGHRPCAECRHEDYRRFQSAWARAGLGGTGADDMDRRLDADRLARPAARRTYREQLETLPDGAYVEIDGGAWLVWQGALRAWSPAGYTGRLAIGRREVTVITPRCLVGVLRAGYVPTIHPSVQSNPLPSGERAG